VQAGNLKFFTFAGKMNNPDLPLFKSRALSWANTFDICCCLDSSDYKDGFGRFDFLIAAGARHSINCKTGQAFEALQLFYETHKNWMFGLFSYDLKNENESLTSEHPDLLGFPDLFFFVPEYLIAVDNGIPRVLLGDPSVLDAIDNYAAPAEMESEATECSQPLNIRQRMDKTTYLQKIHELKQHILRGDIYEVTYCQEFFAEHAAIDPQQVYLSLKELSPTPFSGYFKIYDRYILSSSPERFLCKRGTKLVSQPIKGTAKRHADPKEDELVRARFSTDMKEQTENVMIVDLVRNDLTRSAVQGSVKVEELFGIYSFPQVHQMISTISCELNPDIHFVEAIRNTFPMGSMTGAPKIRAMKLIDKYELSRRGAYSGSFGYLTPDGDFDFNVIIRSILYHQGRQYLSFQVGGAITYSSDAESEYEECMLKASAMIKTLS